MLTIKEFLKVGNGDSVGGHSSGPVSFMQGYVAPLECVQHEYCPPELLRKPRMSLCIFGAISHYLRAVVVLCCLYQLLLTALVSPVNCTSHIINNSPLKFLSFSCLWKSKAETVCWRS